MGLGDLFGSKKDGYKRAKRTYEEVWKKIQEDLEPYRALGQQGLEDYANRALAGPGEFTRDPGYEHRMQEGLRALNYGSAASGRMGSGAHDRDLVRFGQDYASNEYDKFFNRWMAGLNPSLTLAGIGQNAVQSLGNFGMEYARGKGGANIGLGEARAAQMNALNQGIWGTVKDIGGYATYLENPRTSMGVNRASGLSAGRGLGQIPGGAVPAGTGFFS